MVPRTKPTWAEKLEEGMKKKLWYCQLIFVLFRFLWCMTALLLISANISLHTIVGGVCVRIGSSLG